MIMALIVFLAAVRQEPAPTITETQEIINLTHQITIEPEIDDLISTDSLLSSNKNFSQLMEGIALEDSFAANALERFVSPSVYTSVMTSDADLRKVVDSYPSTK